MDVSLEHWPSVAGSLRRRLDRNSIMAGSCMNELEKEETKGGGGGGKDSMEDKGTFSGDTEREREIKMTSKEVRNHGCCRGLFMPISSHFYTCVTYYSTVNPMRVL